MTILPRFDPVEGFTVVAHIQRSCISVTMACSESGHISELFKKHLNLISSRNNPVWFTAQTPVSNLHAGSFILALPVHRRSDGICTLSKSQE